MNIYVKRRLFVFALGLFILYIGYALLNGFARNRAVLRRYAALEARYAAMTRRNEELKLSLTEAQSDEFIELNARDRLGLVKPGETAYKIIEED
ncbi:MAG: septum formation initiator family protein [Candidatus Margulisbacteria bacterium]|jgi:cell division protein FtsB|nr:septum formation initiator family protein [Candidatus Margulisiibacteriota bacterium]